MKTTLLSTIATLLLTAAAAHANTITQTLSTITLQAPESADNWNQSLAFNKFDSSLGTLTSLSVSLTSSDLIFASVYNNANFSQAVQEEFLILDGVQDPLNLFNNSIQNMSIAYGGLSPGGSSSSQIATESDAVLESFSLAAILNEFTGSGTISLPLGTTLSHMDVEGSSFSTAFTAHTQADVTITYTYTPANTAAVPLPSAVWAGAPLLLALGAAKFLRRPTRD